MPLIFSPPHIIMTAMFRHLVCRLEFRLNSEKRKLTATRHCSVIQRQNLRETENSLINDASFTIQMVQQNPILCGILK
jgi:hypothetical protein